MSIPSTCPECADTDVGIVNHPSSKHGYEGWQTAIECDARGERVFAVEIRYPIAGRGSSDDRAVVGEQFATERTGR